MSKKPLAGILALVVILTAGFIVYTQMNKARQVVDIFDKPVEASYGKIIEWSKQYDSVETAKSKTGIGIMMPADTLGDKLKTIFIRRGSAAVSKPYILSFENLRIEAIPTAGTAEQAKASIRNTINQFSNQPVDVKVHGNAGLSSDQSNSTVNGTLYKIPATVCWWENGVIYLAISKNMSAEELLSVCDSAKLQ
jgi:hypothetical protein